MEAQTPIAGMPPTRSRLRKNWFSFALAGFLLVLAVEKYRHGLVQIEGIDFSVPYACTRAWLQGSDPYSGENILRIFRESGVQLEDFKLEYLPPIYPPTTFVVMTPLALPPWQQALRIWGITAIVLLTIMLGSLLHLAGMRWNDPRIGLLILFCMVFGPLRSAIALGQSAILAISLATLAVAMLTCAWNVIPGTLLAIAIAFKPQDALFAAAFFLLMRRWKALIWCAGMFALICLIAIFRPGFSHPMWVMDVLHWIREANVPGAITDPAAPNGARFQMIHLPVLLSTFIHSRVAVSILTACICLILGAAVALLVFRASTKAPPDRSDLLALSALAMFSLLPIYHRFPDGILLLLPMTWAIRRLCTPEEWSARITLLLILPFLIQPYEVLRTLVSSGRLSRAVYEAWWFQCFARASLIWLILVLTCWLVFLLKRQTSPPPA